jgi:hypothetical protein
MPARNHLFEHLNDPKNLDPFVDLSITAGAGRLCRGHGVEAGGWRRIVKLIDRYSPEHAVWFPDTNVAIREDADDVWTAFRLAALGGDYTPVRISPPVALELDEWMKEPYRNEDLARAMREALSDSRSWAAIFDVLAKAELDVIRALCVYTNVLACRRDLAVATDGSKLTPLGVDASNKADAMNAVNHRVGPRGVQLAKKGRDDTARTGKLILHDEIHCLTAITHALMTGRPTFILTTDSDCLEIFFKALWFFDTHYRAYLAAPLVLDGKYGTPITWTDKSNYYFRGPALLYKRHDLYMREVLTTFHTPVLVHILRVTANGNIERISFNFEREMLRMLQVKGETGGLCSNLLEGKNIHIALGPIQNELDGLYLGVAEDNGEVCKALEREMRLPKLDQTHAVFNYERGGYPFQSIDLA